MSVMLETLWKPVISNGAVLQLNRVQKGRQRCVLEVKMVSDP